MIIHYIVVLLVLLASASTFRSGLRTTRAYNAVATSAKQPRAASITNNTDTDASTRGTSTNIQTGDDEEVSDQKSYISDIIHNHLPPWLRTYHAWHANQLATLAALETELQQQTANGDTAADINSDVIRNRTQQFRFLVVVCLDGVTCGGLSDRIKAIPYWLIRANQTNRILLLHWQKNNIGLEEFWVPPPGGLNWSVPQPQEGFGSILSRLLYDETLHTNSCLSKRRGYKRLHRASRPIPGGANGGRQVVCSHHQTYHFEHSPDDMEMYRTERHENSYSYAFRTMFQPSHGFSAYLERMLQGPDLGLQLDTVRYATSTPYLAVHIRSKYPLRWKKGVLVRPSMDVNREVVQYIADHAVDQLIGKYVNVTGTVRIPPIYVASDSSDVVRYLKYNSTRYGVKKASATELNEPRRILNISGDIEIQAPRIMGLESLGRPHIEFINVVATEAEKQSEKDVTSVSDLYPVFLDLWMLTASRCIASGLGGYGRLGYFLSSSNCYSVHMTTKNYKKVQARSKEYSQSMAQSK